MEVQVNRDHERVRSSLSIQKLAASGATVGIVHLPVDNAGFSRSGFRAEAVREALKASVTGGELKSGCPENRAARERFELAMKQP
jgi:hypothetical protein